MPTNISLPQDSYQWVLLGLTASCIQTIMTYHINNHALSNVYFKNHTTIHKSFSWKDLKIWFNIIYSLPVRGPNFQAGQDRKARSVGYKLVTSLDFDVRFHCQNNYSNLSPASNSPPPNTAVSYHWLLMTWQKFPSTFLMGFAFRNWTELGYRVLRYQSWITPQE